MARGWFYNATSAGEWLTGQLRLEEDDVPLDELPGRIAISARATGQGPKFSPEYVQIGLKSESEVLTEVFRKVDEILERYPDEAVVQFRLLVQIQGEQMDAWADADGFDLNCVSERHAVSPEHGMVSPPPRLPAMPAPAPTMAPQPAPAPAPAPAPPYTAQQLVTPPQAPRPAYPPPAPSPVLEPRVAPMHEARPQAYESSVTFSTINWLVTTLTEISTRSSTREGKQAE